LHEKILTFVQKWYGIINQYRLALAAHRKRSILIQIGSLVFFLILQASPALALKHDYIPCAKGSGLGDGCPNPSPGSYQESDFFSGYANQSFGRVLPSITVLQPASYAIQPPWNVAGVDYAVGLPLSYLPISSLKDPANIASDPAANPDGAGADCAFFASSTLASNGGPAVICTQVKPGATGPVIAGYNFGMTGSTNDCVALIIKDNTWSSVTISDNLFVNGPNCNLWHGAPSAANAFQLDIYNGPTAIPVTFSHNTVYGCGPDNPGEVEAQLCLANFPSSGGVAPADNHFWADSPDGPRTVQYNAFIHQPGRIIQGTENCGGYIQWMQYNYVEGFVYQHGGGGEHGEFKEFGVGCAGAVVVQFDYNTLLQTQYVDAGVSEGSDSSFYYSAGSTAKSVTFTGNILNNVFVTNINPNYYPYWTTASAAISFAYNNYGSSTKINNNYIDPTGSAFCFSKESNPTFTGAVTFSGNKSLLSAVGDASMNVFSTAAGACYGSQ
jgi:hypothetical protein